VPNTKAEIGVNQVIVVLVSLKGDPLEFLNIAPPLLFNAILLRPLDRQLSYFAPDLEACFDIAAKVDACP